MARRTWLALGAAVVLTAPLACSSDDDAKVSTDGDRNEEARDSEGGPERDREGGSGGATASFMAKVAENTAETPAYELSMVMEAVDIPDLPAGVMVTIDGAFASDGSKAEMTMDMSPMFEAMAGEMSDEESEMMEGLLGGLAEPTEIVVDGDTTYMKGGVFGALFGAETEWISTPTESSGGDPTGGFGDPGEFLQLLEGAGEVTEEGSEDIDGVETTHYSVEVDLEDLAASAGEEAEMPEIPGLDGVEVTIDVWVDEDSELVRRMAFEIDGSALGGTAGADLSGSMLLTMDIEPLDDFDVEVPDPSEVTEMDMDDLLGGSFGGLGN